MPRFGRRSLDNLKEVHPKLQELFSVVIQHFDCVVIDGSRTVEEQRKNVARGVSKTMKSKHLVQSDGYAHAVDVGPYPLVWTDYRGLYYFGGLVKGIAAVLGIEIRWGGDWDSDNDFVDQTFNDLVHFELVSNEA